MHTLVAASSLTPAEQELIRAAVANHGALEIVTRAELRGRAVVAGRRQFCDPHDRSVAQHFIALVARLRELELVRETTIKNGYELTNFGWQLSRELGR